MKEKSEDLRAQQKQEYMERYQKTLETLKERSILKDENIKFFSQSSNWKYTLRYAEHCAHSGNINDLKLLYMYGIFKNVLPQITHKCSILSEAIRNGKKEITDFLTSQFKDILNTPDELGNTPVMKAVKFDQCKILTLLCEKGADINIADGNGVTPLAFAQSRKNTGILKILSTFIEKNKLGKTKRDGNQQSFDDSEWQEINLDDCKDERNAGSIANLPPQATTDQDPSDTLSVASTSFAILIETGRKETKEKTQTKK